jgi:O-antigen ligase
MLCLVVALALWPVARTLPRASATLIAAGLIGLIAIFPALPIDMDAVARIHEAVPQLANSAVHRFAIWHFAIDRIAERPLLGWGLDASRALPGGSDLIEDPRLPELARMGGLWMPLHPHNPALQWRLELGLPGAARALSAGESVASPNRPRPGALRRPRDRSATSARNRRSQ